jgi:ribose transport system substrate-binding protein
MRWILAVAAGFFALAFAAVGHAQTAQKGKRVAHITSSIQNPFISEVARSFKARAESLGMQVVVHSHDMGDIAAEAQMVDDAIAQKYDLIALLATNEFASLPALTRAKKAGIPVILMNAVIKSGNDDLFVSFVGEDQTTLGRITGDALGKLLTDTRGGGSVALITGSLADNTAPKRIDGFKQGLAKYPKVKIVASEDVKWSTALSERAAGQLFARFAARNGLDAIYAMADNMAIGVAQAANSAGIQLGTGKGQVVLVSSNCMKMGIDLIRAGKQYSTATQLPGSTGVVAADLTADYFNGKKLQKNHILPMKVITRENVEEYAKPCTF